MGIKTGLWLVVALLAGPIPAAIAAGGREDNSPWVVWTFLGFCALIIVAQLVPAVRSTRRAAATAAAAERERVMAEQAEKVRVQN